MALVALALRLVHLDHTPYVDELYHMLAARSLLADGTLMIPGGGPYDRAWVFTYAIAGLQSVFGESLVVARSIAVVAGTGLVVTLFAWLRYRVDRTAAWIAALLLATYPAAIQLSQFVRFYTLHAWLILVGVLSVYELGMTRLDDRRRLVRLHLLAVGAFGLAFHLHRLTLVAVAALGLWLVLTYGRSGRRWFRARPFWRGVLILIAASCIPATLVAVRLRLFDYLVYMTWNRVDLWAFDGRDKLRVYHWLLLDHYPTIWPLFPLLLLLALGSRFRQAWLCVCVFGFGLIYQSIAAWKVERYIFYLMPFFFALVGMGMAALLPAVTRAVDSALRRLPAGIPGLVRGETARVFVLVVVLGFAVASNGAFRYSYHMLVSGDSSWPYERRYRGFADWGSVADQIRDRAHDGAVVVSSSGPKALYFLDRLDFILVANEVRKRDGQRYEFGHSSTFRRPIISRPESIELLMRCRSHGVIVTEARQLGKPHAVPRSTRDFIVENTIELPVPEQSRIRVFEWHTPAPVEGCRLSEPGAYVAQDPTTDGATTKISESVRR